MTARTRKELLCGLGSGFVGLLLLLLAPDGRLPGDRWKPAAWLGITAIVLATAWVAVSPYPRGPRHADDAAPCLAGLDAALAALLAPIIGNIHGRPPTSFNHATRGRRKPL